MFLKKHLYCRGLNCSVSLPACLLPLVSWNMLITSYQPQLRY